MQLLAAQGSTGQLGAQGLVLGMLEQPIAQGFEGLLHAIAQLPQHPFTRLLRLLLPDIEHAAARLRMAEAAGVQQQPEHGELIEQLALYQ